MKSLRILVACTLAAFASVALVRADGQCGKKDPASCGGCPAQKKEEKKCTKDDGCASGPCAKPEKKDAPKTTS
ncbi:MAG: hypothetical protein H2172_13035 [Opitutus sp.]|nr:hypothetical protein [Opitutus sp.]MCS6247112.1 hypothetical protein [Opitutus sp.]MCS6273462.1 hypothetical protein [Opitutus sp.]MCS6275817.1 hypothetical protein [Opitutus sp.]MCS6300913.1 hypothetical protein [Opitutus sp.]